MQDFMTSQGLLQTTVEKALDVRLSLLIQTQTFLLAVDFESFCHKKTGFLNKDLLELLFWHNRIPTISAIYFNFC